MQQNNLTLGQYIRQQCEKRGWSAQVLADKCGVNKSSINRVEHDMRAIRQPEFLKALATAFEVPIADIYALANLTIPKELPTFTPYPRTKYPNMPAAARKELEKLAEKYHLDNTGPAPGEDEA